MTNRLFIYLRMHSDDNHALDGAAGRFEESGHPVVRLDMRDRYDIGAELFRWQFAVSVAGTVLGVNPFDQPDVQRSKEETDSALEEYVRRGRLPDMEPEGSLAGTPGQIEGRRLPLDHGIRPADAGDGPDDCQSEAARDGGAQDCDDRGLRAAVPALHRTAPQRRARFRTIPADHFEGRGGRRDPRSTLHLRHSRRRAGYRRPENPEVARPPHRENRAAQPSFPRRREPGGGSLASTVLSPTPRVASSGELCKGLFTGEG